MSAERQTAKTGTRSSFGSIQVLIMMAFRGLYFRTGVQELFPYEAEAETGGIRGRSPCDRFHDY